MNNSAQMSTIGDITTWYSGGTPSRARSDYWSGDIPWISAFTLKDAEINTSDQFLTPEAVAAGSRMAPLGSTLLLVRGSALHNVIRAGMVTSPVAFNQDVKALVPKRGVVPKYLTHVIRGNEHELLKLVTSSGNTAGVLDTNVVQAFEIYLPNEHDQRRLVEAFDDVDKLIATLERLITKKQAIKQGLMQQLLTGKIRLPGFAGQWNDVVLGDHVSYIKTVALSRAQLDNVSIIRYLHYGDIHTRNSVRLNAATEDMPRASHLLVGSAGILRVGDLVFADASEDPAGVGKSVEIASVPEDGLVPGLHTIAARFNKSVLADGFKAYLQFIPTFRESLLRLAAGTKVLATTRSYISSISISLPQVDEQRAIAQVIMDADEEIDRIKSRLSKAKAIKQGMMQELLTGRIRLPVMEPAS